MTQLPNSARLYIVERKYFDDNGCVLGASIMRQWCRALDIGLRIESTELFSMPLGIEPEDLEHMFSKMR